MLIRIFRDCSRFSCGFTILVKLDLGMLVFDEKGKLKKLEKPLEEGKNQPQTLPTHGSRLESNIGHISGE